MKFLMVRLVSSVQFQDVPFDEGAMWRLPEPRSVQRFLHGFLFFSDWFGTVLEEPVHQEEASRLAEEIVAKWHEMYSNYEQHFTSMAYHDETTAQRLISLLALKRSLEKIAPGRGSSLDPVITSTAELLGRPSFHAGLNNHGMFQDLARLYWAVLESGDAAERQRVIEQSLSSLKTYFKACFTEEGVHTENSPTYHVMIARVIENLRLITAAAEHIDETFYVNLIKQAEVYATHCIMPNRTFPPISDTQQIDLSNSGHTRFFRSPEFLFSSTGGQAGIAPRERMLLLPQSGYAIYRSAWDDENATFGFFSAAYNADYHKHSDDLSFFLRSKGVDLLSESGPYSYDYKNPLSRYAYSQYAHNSLVVDRKSLPRTDRKANQVSLRVVEKRCDGFKVIGRNARYDDVVHDRVLGVSEKSGVPEFSIIDCIQSQSTHDYEFLWNLGTEVAVTVHAQGFELFANGEKVMDLAFVADVSTRISVHEGEMKPRPLGWRFPKFGEAVPTKVVVIQFSGSSVKVDTKIRLADFSYNDRQLSSRQSEWSRFEAEVPLNYLFVPARTAEGRRRLAVAFSAIGEVGDFTYNYRATLDQLDVSALYILDDFGSQGAYYHSDHRSEAIFRTVQRLISEVCSKEGLQPTSVATVGSSKGGTAALMHGSAFGAGRIIVGAPQTRVGTFLAKPHPNILEYMAGGTTDEDVRHLDSIVFKQLENIGNETSISVLVGAEDHHLLQHVEPLMEHMKTIGATAPKLAVLPDLTHSDIGGVYRHFLTANLEQWMRGSHEEALPYTLICLPEDQSSIRLKLYCPTGTRVAYRLFRDNEIVRRRSYSSKDVVVFKDLGPGRYRVRVFTRVGDSSEASAFTTRWITL